MSDKEISRVTKVEEKEKGTWFYRVRLISPKSRQLRTKNENHTMRKGKRNTKETFLVGDVVNYHSIIGGPVYSSGHTIKEIGVLHGMTVAWITGKTGCVAIEALSK